MGGGVAQLVTSIKIRMKIILIAGTVAAVVLTGTTAKAQIVDNTTTWFSEHFQASESSGALFNPEEIALDLGLNWYSRDRGRNEGQFGFGFGGKYFFTREIGLSVDSNIGFNGHAFFDFLHASAIYRFPIEEYRIAPYAIAGTGCEFDPSTQLSGHFGGGVEFRFNAVTGIYGDVTYNLVHSASDYFLLRGGIRILF
ncbi:hypothetical protein [Pedosphaera parvula]|uniref:hypothetical protein n=1 Tax=Pedosphaera parvula TaxID=1032527 RepID=UPI00135F1506|nr:hypothetical protein [Pedosphaera parvula]